MFDSLESSYLSMHSFVFEQIEDMVGGLVNQAAQTVNFTNTSFLPEQAQTFLNDFVNASIQNINVTGKLYYALAIYILCDGKFSEDALEV